MNTINKLSKRSKEKRLNKHEEKLERAELMNIDVFKLCLEQMLEGSTDPDDYSNQGEIAHQVFEQAEQSALATANMDSSYPTQIFELSDGYVAITYTSYDISSTGDDFTGSASTWREDYV